jgi:prevent-host-death family protein
MGLMWPHVAMRRIKIAEFKNHLSEHLRAVEAGIEVEVTDRRRPIVRLSPVATGSEAAIIPAHRPFREIATKRYRPARWRTRSLDLLLQERGRR